MLVLTATALAGVWNVCSATEATASANAGWTIVEVRDSDGGQDVQRGTYTANSSLVRRFEARRDEDLCNATDGVGGATRRWTSELIAVDALPVGGSCKTSIWAEGYVDAGGRAKVTPYEISGSVVGHSVTRAAAGNTGVMSVDGGGGAAFVAEWDWQVPGRTAEVAGTVVVDAQSAYNGSSLQIPGWATVEAFDGKVDAWLRRGGAWVHVTGEAPMNLEFGAISVPRGRVCAQATTSSGAQSQVGESGIGGSGIHFTMDTVRSTAAIDATPMSGPTFDECGCE